MTVQTAFLYSIIIANGQWRGSKGNINGIPESRFQHVHFSNHLVCQTFFPLHIIISPVTDGRMFPLTNGIERHDTIYNHAVRPRALIVGRRSDKHKPLRKTVFGILAQVPNGFVVLLEITGMVDIRIGLRLELYVNTKSRIAVGNLFYPIHINTGKCPIARQRKSVAGWTSLMYQSPTYCFLLLVMTDSTTRSTTLQTLPHHRQSHVRRKIR